MVEFIFARFSRENVWIKLEFLSTAVVSKRVRREWNMRNADTHDVITYYRNLSSQCFTNTHQHMGEMRTEALSSSDYALGGQNRKAGRLVCVVFILSLSSSVCPWWYDTRENKLCNSAKYINSRTVFLFFYFTHPTFAVLANNIGTMSTIRLTDEII